MPGLVAVLVAVAVVAGTLVVLAVRALLPSTADAAANAQAAADRVLPGVVRVTGTRFEFTEAAVGYDVSAVLVADPVVHVDWGGDRRCAPGSSCEAALLTSVANVRDGAAEVAALQRGFARCGVEVRGTPAVMHTPRYGPSGPDITATVTLVAPRPDLGGPAGSGTAATLDRCVAAWAAERAGLLPAPQAAADLSLVDADGTVHSSAEVRASNGRVTTSAASTLAPYLRQDQRDALSTALDAPVRAALRAQGFDPTYGTAVDEVRYVAGDPSRVDVVVRGSRVDPVDPSRMEVVGVALTCARDGSASTGVHVLR